MFCKNVEKITNFSWKCGDFLFVFSVFVLKCSEIYFLFSMDREYNRDSL